MSKYLWQVVIYTIAKLCPDFVNLNLIKIFVYKHKPSMVSYTIRQVFKENNQKAYLLAVAVATFVCLFDLILYVPSTIFQLNGTGLPGSNQYLPVARINVSCSRTTTQ